MGLEHESEFGKNGKGIIVLLGGAGFIGTRLAELLLAQGFSVRIGDVRPSERFPEFSVQCDVRNCASISEIVREASAIINLAAEHRDDVRPLSRYYETNVQGAANLCEAARQAGIGNIVFTSSAAVYGFQPRPVDETGPFEPFNEYGTTKLAAEGIYKAWATQDPKRTLVIIRPTVVFGEGNRGNVYSLLHQIASNRFLMVGAGKNKKSMAYVGNVAAFLCHLLTAEPGIHVYNYVDGPDMEMRDLVDHVRQCLGKTGNPPSIPMPLGLMAGHLLDVAARLSNRRFPISAIRVRKFCESTQFRAELVAKSGFVPPTSLVDGLARVIDFEFRQERH